MIGELDDRIAFQEQSLPSFNRYHPQFRVGTDTNRFNTDHRHIETHVLIRLGDFDHDRAFARERAATFDRVIRSLKRFHRNNCSVLHDDGLPDIESRDFFRDFPAQIDIFLFTPR